MQIHEIEVEHVLGEVKGQEEAVRKALVIALLILSIVIVSLLIARF